LRANCCRWRTGVGDHVEQRRGANADLSLDRDGRDCKLEVLRGHALGHLDQSVFHRPAEEASSARAEFLIRRWMALVDNGLEALLERVACLQRAAMVIRRSGSSSSKHVAASGILSQDPTTPNGSFRRSRSARRE